MRFNENDFIRVAVEAMENEKNPLMLSRFSEEALIGRALRRLGVEVCEGGIQHCLPYDEYLEVQIALGRLAHDVPGVAYDGAFYRLEPGRGQ